MGTTEPSTGPGAAAPADPEVERWIDASIERRKGQRTVRHGPALAVPAEGSSSAAVVLGRAGAGWRHVGSVGVRGPAAPGPEAWGAAGLREPEAVAARFVAAWFGAPFDAVGGSPAHPFAWGVWRFDAPGLARVLRAWAQRDREACNAALQGHKIEVRAGETGASLGIDGQFDAAAWRRDPRIVATLAAMGRNPQNQLAQLEVVARRHVRALLDASIDEHRTVEEALDAPSAREIGALLALELRHGRVRTLRILRKTPRKGELLADLAAWLRSEARAADANLVQWVQNSPELEVA